MVGLLAAELSPKPDRIISPFLHHPRGHCASSASSFRNLNSLFCFIFFRNNGGRNGSIGIPPLAQRRPRSSLPDAWVDGLSPHRYHLSRPSVGINLRSRSSRTISWR